MRGREVTVDPLEPTAEDILAWDSYWQARPRHGVRLTIGDTSTDLSHFDVVRLIDALERGSRV